MTLCTLFNYPGILLCVTLWMFPLQCILPVINFVICRWFLLCWIWKGWSNLPPVCDCSCWCSLVVLETVSIEMLFFVTKWLLWPFLHCAFASCFISVQYLCARFINVHIYFMSHFTEFTLTLISVLLCLISRFISTIGCLLYSHLWSRRPVNSALYHTQFFSMYVVVDCCGYLINIFSIY